LLRLAQLPAPYFIAGVYSQPPRQRGRGMRLTKSPTHHLAESLSLAVFTPPRLDEAAIAQLKALAPDILVVVAYGLILPEAVLGIPRLCAINAHASLLPKWRGAAPIERAIAAGDQVTGVTLMRITKKLDSGPILAKAKIPIAATDTGGSLHDTLAKLAADMLAQHIPSIVAGEASETRQNESAASYAHKINDDDTRLDFDLPKQQVLASIRAFAPRPGAWCIDLTPPQRRLMILSAEAAEGVGKAGECPGQCLGRGKRGGIVLATSDGAIEVMAIKPAGKAVMSAADYLNGNPLPKILP
ncbi:MAG: methionyl-tRNA formyltransferase, partial [Proteobacteria bacterium]|nr:methionyl-tRNA formyltransferase [Pseudomonadota bacterium]